MSDYLNDRVTALRAQQQAILTQIQQGDKIRADMINQGNALEGGIQELIAAIAAIDTPATPDSPAVAPIAPDETPDAAQTA